MVGWLLTAAGAVGVITGIVPLTINTLRIVVDEHLWNLLDFAAHGVESMGLSLEWGMLSSAMGMCLGVLLLCAGRGWRKGYAWAAPVSGAYVLTGLAVNISDMLICCPRNSALLFAVSPYFSFCKYATYNFWHERKCHFCRCSKVSKHPQLCDKRGQKDDQN